MFPQRSFLPHLTASDLSTTEAEDLARDNLPLLNSAIVSDIKVCLLPEETERNGYF